MNTVNRCVVEVRNRLFPVRLAAAVGLAIALGLTPAQLHGQNCNYNGTNGNCQTTSNNTNSLRLTITAATRLALSSATVTLTAPTATDFEAGVGTGTSLDLVMRANTAWSLVFYANASTWGFSGPLARTDRPVSDLQWANALAGPYTDMVTTSTSLYSGAPATAGTSRTLYFRAKYAWLLDSPGTYTMGLTFTISAP